MDDHGFCRMMLTKARQEAKAKRIEIPKGLVALRSDKKQFWVEHKGGKGRYIKADCAFDAKAQFIWNLIENLPG